MPHRKRASISLSAKQEALCLSGVLPEGATGAPLLDEQTKKSHTPISFAKILKFSHIALYKWRQKASEILLVSQKDAKRMKAI